MKEPVVIIGIGELAGVFAHGFLRCGHPVYPVTRQMDMASVSQQIPSPCLVLVTVPENELHPVLEKLPEVWRNKTGLLQNELLPRDWQRHKLDNPTITVVWFEKKKGQVLSNILYTPSFGPNATLIADALQTHGIPVHILEDEDALLYELCRKALYILTVNISGLEINCTVSELWYQHQTLAREVATESISIMEWLTGKELNSEKLITGMVAGIDDCPDRFCLGRTALARLQRALAFAQEAGIAAPKLLEIYSNAK